MRSLHRDQSGLAYAAITALTSLIIIAIIWNVMSPTMQNEVFDYAQDELQADNNFTDLEDTYNLIDFVWQYWPLILIISVVLYLFLASQRPGASPY